MKEGECDKMKKVVVAIGGNAISRPGEKGTCKEQLEHIRTICKQLVQLVLNGLRIVITHGNGPQVGNILLQNEISAVEVPSMPLDVCVAESQGMIGYLIQQSLLQELHRAGKKLPVISLITQVLVDGRDPAFEKPTKPVGVFYSSDVASNLEKERGWRMISDAGRGYRHVVPSPEPVAIIESEVIKNLVEQGAIVIAVGGGGIPVVMQNGELAGVEGVIDKDLAAQRLAAEIDAETLLLLTDVEQVALNYGKPNQRFLERLTYSDGKKLQQEGHFASGSMGPKIEAALRHLEMGGKMAVIGKLDNAYLAATGSSGTRITLNDDVYPEGKPCGA